MNLPMPATPLPAVDPTALAGPSPETTDASTSGGSDFGSKLEEVQPDTAADAAGAIERTNGVGATEVPQAIHELVNYALEHGSSMKPAEMMALQMRVHEMSFQLESVSKAIEHGMSGTKTLLQTQA